MFTGKKSTPNVLQVENDHAVAVSYEVDTPIAVGAWVKLANGKAVLAGATDVPIGYIRSGGNRDGIATVAIAGFAKARVKASATVTAGAELKQTTIAGDDIPTFAAAASGDTVVAIAITAAAANAQIDVIYISPRKK